MKELVPKDEYGIFADIKDTPRVDSLFVAKWFEKRHADVLRDIAKITDTKSGLSDEFRERNFALTSYNSQQNKKQPCYAMTRDGFTMLVMGYTGKKAARFKEAYIKRFNDMEKFIGQLVTVRKDFPLLTENIKLIHNKPTPYHFANECDMINRLVLGMSAKQFKQKHNIEKTNSIRPYLTKEQIGMIDKLQRVDVGLLISVPDFEQRKRHLEWYLMKTSKAS